MTDPAPARPPTGPPRSPVGLPAMILGIISIPLLLVYALGIPAGLVAIGLGVWDLRNGAQGRPSNRTQAIIGIGCGAIALVGAVVLIARPDS